MSAVLRLLVEVATLDAKPMTTRVLSYHEHAQLPATDLAAVLPMLPGSRVIVCEQAGAIVGHLALIPLWHVEGAYVAPGKRGKGVLQALIAAMHADARAMGVATVYPAADQDAMAHFITRNGGVEIPVRWFSVAVQEI